MGDPLDSVSSSSLKFVKLLSPKMKSVYWRHFGFPTNENDRIITKQSVVCTLCHKVLTNHGNTTNLRAHLQHRHKDMFRKICDEHNIHVPPRKPNKSAATNASTRKNKLQPKLEKMKYEYGDEINESSRAPSISTEDHSMLYETMVPMTYEDDDAEAQEFAKIEIRGGDITETKSNDSNDEMVFCRKVERKSASRFRVNQIEEVNCYQLQDALVNMIVKDMRNVDTIYDPGMSSLIRTLSGSVVIPPELKIESLITEMHTDKLSVLADTIKEHSQLKPFSLGFEVWENVESKHFLSIYFNHLTDAPDYNLLNELFCTVEYNKFTNIDSIFAEFNMENCTAAIVSYDCDDYLKHFLKNKKIPVVLSYDVTVDKCLKNTFALPGVAAVIDQVKDIVSRHSTEISDKNIEIPTPNESFPWTYYELLNFFVEMVSWPEDMDGLVSSAKTIAETVSALAVTLDTLKGEEIPHSSMLSPITSKIVNTRLVFSEEDDELISAIKCSIAADLKKLVLDDDHLTISALLDPRFHRLTSVSNLNSCLAILTEKLNKIFSSKGKQSLTKQDNAKAVISASKKSNLEMFFEIVETPKTAVAPKESNIENDLTRYRNEVYATLDESPFLWWNKMGGVYPSLKHFVSAYQCIPCVVNMNFRKPVKQQIYEHQKRSMLSGKLIDAILFLHHNELMKSSNSC